MGTLEAWKEILRAGEDFLRDFKLGKIDPGLSWGTEFKDVFTEEFGALLGLLREEIAAREAAGER